MAWITFGGLKFTAFGYVLSGNTLALGGGENRFQLGGGDDLQRGFTLMGSAQVQGQPRSE